jgi:glycosyltransferase involved in cell wall biosynthesis
LNKEILIKKKVLVFIDWYLPGFKAGGPIQSCANIVDHLKDYFDFSIVTGDTDYTDIEPYPGIVPNSWNSHNGTPVYYFSKASLTWKNILKILKKEKYDIIYFNSLFSFHYTIIPLILLYLIMSPCKIIMAPRGMFGAGALSVKSTKKKIFIKTMLLTGIFKKVVFHASTPEEKTDIEKNLGPGYTVQIAPNLLSIQAPEMCRHRNKEKGNLKTVSIARISPEKNLQYTLTALAKLKGEISFDIYGPIYNEKYWTQCQEIIKDLPENIKVNYNGSLEKKNVHQVLLKHHLLIHPTLGENFGHIILEAMGAGCPVLISDKTPWHALESKFAGADIPLNETLKFIEFIEKFCAFNQEEFNVYSEYAYKFDWDYVNDTSVLSQNIALFS